VNPQGSPEMTSNIENANTPEQVRAETRAALELAKKMVWVTEGHPNVQQSFIADYNQVTWEYTWAYTQELQEAQARLARVLSGESEASESQEEQIRIWKMKEMLWILLSNHSSDRNQFAWNLMMFWMNPDYKNVDFIRYFFEQPYAGEIGNFITSNPQYLQKFVENDLAFIAWCAWWEEGEKMMQLQQTIREAYLEIKETQVRESLHAYYLNAGISQDRLDTLAPQIQNLIWNEETWLVNWDCNISNIARIADFNKDNFTEDEQGILTLTEVDARNILGSIIEVRRTENEIALANLRDQISQITGLSFDEIQAAIASWNAKSIGKLLNPYRDNNPRIAVLEWEIFELLDIQRGIVRQEATFDQVIANSGAIYNMAPKEKEAFIKKLKNKFDSLQDAIDFINNLDEFSWTQENIDFIRDDVAQRISIIRKPQELIRYFKEFPEDFNKNFSIWFIYPSLLFNPKIIEAYPGQITSLDIWLIPQAVFKNNPGLIEMLLWWSHDIRNLIINLSQDKELIGTLHQALVSIHEKNPDHPSLRDINLQVLNYDRDNWMYLQQFADSHNNINGLTQKEIEWKIEKDGVDQHVALIDLFLQSNPNTWITIEWKYMNQSEIYIFLIEKWYFPLLTSLHWNPNISEDIVKTVLGSENSDIWNVRFIAKNHMNDIENIRLLIEGIKESDDPKASLLFLQYINIVWENGNIDPIKALDIAVLIKNNLQNIMSNAWVELGSWIMWMIAWVLQGITEQEMMEISRNKERLDMFMMLTGLVRLRQAAMESKERALEIQNEQWILALTTKFIESESLDREKELLDELRSKREISQEILNILLREFHWKEDKLEDFLAWLHENLVKDLKNSKDRLERRTYSNTEEIPSELRSFIIENSENWEPMIDYEQIWTSFQNFLANLSPEEQSLSPDEKKQLFLEQILWDTNKESQIYQDISEWIRINENLTQLSEQTVEEIIFHGRNGTLNEYNSKIQERFYNGEIFYSATNKGTIKAPASSSIPLSENFSSQNPEFRTFQHQIGAEMWLTRYESETLSPQEMRILGNNETAKDNFKFFKRLLNDYNLDIIWNYRNQIFPLLSPWDGKQFDISRNYLEKNEINIFLKWIMYAVTWLETYKEWDILDTTLQKIRVENQLWVIWWMRDKSGVWIWWWIIEREFINRFTHLNDWDIWRFKVNAFRQAQES